MNIFSSYGKDQVQCTFFISYDVPNKTKKGKMMKEFGGINWECDGFWGEEAATEARQRRSNGINRHTFSQAKKGTYLQSNRQTGFLVIRVIRFFSF